MARPIIRAASGTILSKRVEIDGLTIPAETASNYDNPINVPLLVSQETIDEEVEANGTVAAQIPLYSRLIALRLNLQILAGAASQGFRWILYKSPDGDLTITSLANNTNFHDSNDSTTNREVRAQTIAKGFLISNASSNVNRVPVFVRRKALKRIQSFREGDILKLAIATNSATAASLHGFGTLWVKANA